MNNPYLLTEADVQPELLTADERARFNAEYDRVTRQVYDVERSREAGIIYDERERLLDSYARQVGFHDYKDLSDSRWDKRRETPESIVAMRKFYALQNSAEYLDVNQRIRDVLDKYDARLDMHRQQHYYRILQVTRPRMDTLDNHKRPVQSLEEWMDGFRAEYEKNFCTTLQPGEGFDSQQADQLAARLIARHDAADGISASARTVTDSLRQAGLAVLGFHTGFVCDNPDDRYIRDDASLGVRAGEHRSWGSQPHGFELIIRDDGFDRDVLSDIAVRSGMHMVAGDTDGTPSVVFTLPATVDGCSVDAVLLEHCRLSDGQAGGGATLDAALFKRIGDAHGGWAVYSDDMARHRASTLCSHLLNRVTELKASRSEVESLDRVDVARLLDSYVGLLSGVYGAERAGQIRRSILDGTADWDALLPKKDADVSRTGHYVFLDTRTSQVTVIDRAQAKYPPAMLAQAHIVQVGDRISHVSVYPGLGDGALHRLRCRIDGQGQQSVTLSPAQDRLWQQACRSGKQDAARLRLAAECFAYLLSQPVAIDRGRGCGR